MALKVEEVARRLNVSVGMVYREIKQGRLKAVRIGSRMLRVKEEDLADYIRRQETKVVMMEVI